MLSMKSVAAALVLVASAADIVAPALVAPAVVLGVSTAAKAAPVPAIVRHQASRPAPLAG